MEFSIAVLKPGFEQMHIDLLEKEIEVEQLTVFYKFSKQFSEVEVEKYFSTSLNIIDYRNYMSSAPCMIFLVGGRLCSYKLRQVKKRIRKKFNVDSTMVNNIIHSADDGVEFYLQSMSCKHELDSLGIEMNGFADMCVFDSKNEESYADIRALIFPDKNLCDKSLLGEYDYIGFESIVRYQGKNIRVLNYLYDDSCEYISAVYFENEMFDYIDVLKYLDNVGVKGILLYSERVNLTIAEEVEDYLENNLPDWFIIGGDGVTIGEYNYNKFRNTLRSSI